MGGEREDPGRSARLEDALFEQRDLADRLLDAAPVVVLVLDPEARIVRFNPFMEKLSGYALDEVRGTSWVDVFVPERFRSSIRRVFELTADDIQTSGTINPILTKGGGEIELEWYNRILTSAGGEIAGVLAIGLDISDRKLAENERGILDERIRQAQKLESLGVLAGGVAHDFNNILAAILGNADLGIADVELDHPARESLEEIRKAAGRAAGLCRQMLAYSGRGKFVVQPVSLSELVREMQPMLDVSAGRNVSLVLDLDDGVPDLVGDLSEMRQVILNLVSNAAEAIGSDTGTIRITTSDGMYQRDALRSAYFDDGLPEGRYVALSVKDDGEGMDVPTREKMFDPFFTTRFTGRGLGLAAVLGIVRGHRGLIDVVSEPGRGSTFTVLLPARGLKTGQPGLQRRGADASSAVRTILIADDERQVLDVASRMLERLGYRVLKAASGRQALEQFGAHHSEIDCVILDLMMPEMGGEEAFREIRSISKSMPVIISSGYSEKLVFEKFRGEHVSGFIDKPFDMKTLTRVLATIF
jgi:PAS domain S-box-containing protein